MLLRHHNKYLGLSGKILTIGVIFAALITFFPATKQVTARQTLSTSSNSSGWGAASFPVENFQAYTSPFGYRRSATGGNNWEFHNGLDLAAPKGSYVRNWWVGTVIKVGDRGACGTHIIIKSGDWQHSYCHLEGMVGTNQGRRYMIDRSGGIIIWEGQQIPAGVRIGRVGMTGRTTGPHLHWTIRYRGNYVDPAMVLQEMFAHQRNNRVTGQSFIPKVQQLNIDESNYIRNQGY